MASVFCDPDNPYILAQFPQPFRPLWLPVQILPVLRLPTGSNGRGRDGPVPHHPGSGGLPRRRRRRRRCLLCVGLPGLLRGGPLASGRWEAPPLVGVPSASITSWSSPPPCLPRLSWLGSRWSSRWLLPSQGKANPGQAAAEGGLRPAPPHLPLFRGFLVQGLGPAVPLAWRAPSSGKWLSSERSFSPAPHPLWPSACDSSGLWGDVVPWVSPLLHLGTTVPCSFGREGQGSCSRLIGVRPECHLPLPPAWGLLSVLCTTSPHPPPHKMPGTPGSFVPSAPTFSSTPPPRQIRVYSHRCISPSTFGSPVSAIRLGPVPLGSPLT